jgi:hypothetical protein
MTFGFPEQKMLITRSEGMTKKSAHKKRSLMWIGLTSVFATLAVIGYHWFTQDRESKEGCEDTKREVRVKIIKKKDHMSRRPEQTQSLRAEKGISYPDQGNKSDDCGKGDSVHQDNLSTVTSDDEHRKFTERVVAERPVESKARDSDQETFLEGSRSADRETGRDEPDYSDAEPPEVTAIWFDPQQVLPGANISIYVKATDNLSGISSISGTAKSPSGTAVLSFGCERSDSEDSFVGTSAIPDRAEMGRWCLTYLQVTDKVYNSKTYSPNSALLADSCFEVVGSDSDNVPPEVTAVYVSPLEVDGGGSVQVTVEAEDDKSGVARISGVFMSPSKHARLSFSCSNEGEPNLFYGNLTIPEDAESGQWTLESLQAQDEARNAKTFNRANYPSLFDHASVHVHTNGSDSQPPTLDNLITYPTTVAYGETAQITVYASDDTSGISSISGGLLSPSGTAQLHFSCIYDQENDGYQAEVVIPNNAEIGLWRVGYIRMIDKARNEIDYVYQKNALVRQAVFEIIGE